MAYILLRALRRHEWPDIGDVLGIALETGAVIVGIRLAVIAIGHRNLGPFVEEDRIFIPIAGVALLLVAARKLYDTIRDGVK